MRYLKKLVLPLLAAAAMPVVFTTGCTVHAGYYDPYYNDHHQRAHEEPYYDRWERDSHRRHEELNRRNKEEQREYWEWRHRHQHD